MIFIGCLLFACTQNNDDPLTIGEEWINSDTKVIFIDTMKVQTSTIQLDSILMNTERILTGSYQDSYLGKIQTKSYLYLNYTSFNSINSHSEYDSIALILMHDNYFYNDTLQPQFLKVSEITDDLKPIENDVYYNTNEIESSNFPLANFSYHPNPIKNDSIHIRLDDAFGEQLFNEIKHDEINDANEFYERYKGLIVENTQDNASVIGFSENSILRLYYKNESEFEEEAEYQKDFNVLFWNSFNNIQTNKENTVLSDLETEEDEVSSISNNNESYAQAGTGILTKIDIPHYESIYDIQGEGTIVGAKLKLPVKANSESDNLYISDSLRIIILNSNHTPFDELKQTKEDAAVIGILNRKNNEFNELFYEFDIKSFLELKLREPFTEYYLGVYPVNFQNSVERIVFENNPSKEEKRATLELTYALYDDE